MMKNYRKKDHGINLTQTGVVNVLRYSPKIECCKNLKKCEGGMTFVEALVETTVLSLLKNYKDQILRSMQSLYSILLYFFRVKRERDFLTFSGIFTTCSNNGLHSFKRYTIKRVSL